MTSHAPFPPSTPNRPSAKGMALLFCLLLAPLFAAAQQSLILQQKKELAHAADSNLYADRLNNISSLYLVTHLDSCLHYAESARDLSRRIHYPKGLADASVNLGACFTFQNNSAVAHRLYLEALSLYGTLGDSAGICTALYCIGGYYHYEGNATQARGYMESAMGVGSRLLKDSVWSTMLANYYIVFNNDPAKADSARWALHKARDIAIRYHDDRMITYTGLFLAHEKVGENKLDLAMEQLRMLTAHAAAEKMHYLDLYGNAQMVIYTAYLNDPDSIKYRQRMLEAATAGGYRKLMIKPVVDLYEYYKKNDPAVALRYADILQEIAMHQEKLRSRQEQNYMESFLRDQELNNYRLDRQLREQTETFDRMESRNRATVIVFLLVCVALTGLLLYTWYHGKTENRKIRNRVVGVNRLVTEKNQLLHRHDDFKNKLLTILAHDFRTPLSHIINVAELFSKKDLTPAQYEEIANTIAAMAKDTLKLFETVLSWIRSQLSGFDYNPVPHSLAALWDEVLELYDADIQAKGLRLEVLIPEGLKIRGDREMLQFVHRNLMHNAIKFSLKASAVSIRATRDKERAVISVTNGGAGISEVEIYHIFEYKVPGKYVREGIRGAGLALIICKDFIEKMEGSITVHSDGRSYTTFEYTLMLENDGINTITIN
ncbi:HAMP domain-containing sensor histidine kinase [Chitinophaga sp.]|uniref:sensor histidine kinase n=1 Tax=Chitinophaga sp. TaxID=1869181 RepID=UPI00260B63ED|nr:HAMP domain-containing sensor histidine kinase [uncultured Chitinophaga sp.]